MTQTNLSDISKTVEGQLEWLRRQPWSRRAISAWRGYWRELDDARVSAADRIAVVDNDLALVRFLAGWLVAEESGEEAREISLPFIWFARDRYGASSILHLTFVWQHDGR